jgi:four helix bundle protein
MTEADQLQIRADAFSDASVRFVKSLPTTMVAQRMGTQYLDASTSVAANYRAARRGRSYAEFTAKIGLVAEEADESVFWLNRLINAEIGNNIETKALLSEAIELAKIFNAAARTARRRRRRSPNAPMDK